MSVFCVRELKLKHQWRDLLLKIFLSQIKKVDQSLNVITI